VAALLFGGVALVPALVQRCWRPAAERGRCCCWPLRRARFQRRTASAAVAGVVASLALSVALTVMVASFRDRACPPGWTACCRPTCMPQRGQRAPPTRPGSNPRWCRPARCPAWRGCRPARTRALPLAPGRPAVALIAQAAGRPARQLPLLGPVLPRCAGRGRRLGQRGHGRRCTARAPATRWLPCRWAPRVQVRVLGVWRDYARQFGAIAIDAADYRRLTGDTRINDLALWLAPGAEPAPCRRPLRALLPDPAMLDFAATASCARVAAHLRPQLRRHLLPAGGGHRDRAGGHRGQPVGAGAGAAQGIRPAGPPGADARAR
jgi:putative ABC transport system permease protein